MLEKSPYDERVREVEHGLVASSHFVFSAAGGLGPAANVAYKWIASEKQLHQNIFLATGYVNSGISLLRTAVMCPPWYEIILSCVPRGTR